MRTYVVGTFLHRRPGRTLRISHIAAYTRDYNRSWETCKEYQVEANSGAEAKRIARERRLRDEQRADVREVDGV